MQGFLIPKADPTLDGKPLLMVREALDYPQGQLAHPHIYTFFHRLQRKNLTKAEKTTLISF